jgi:RNA polymerase sigma-70 factor (ECF subfamily)
LLKMLDPDVVLRQSTGTGLRVVRGATAVASGAVVFQRLALQVRPVLVNGVAGVVAVDADGAPYSVASFTVVGGRIAEIDIVTDPDQLRRSGVLGVLSAAG